ncbi:hypothetical protein Tco_1487071, partial [Tanacetum coccineum]
KNKLSLRFSNGDVIVVEEDHDVIHDNNSSYLAQSANLNDLDFATLNIDGQSTEVEAPPLIIPVDNDDDFINDEDDVPYDLSDSDNEMVAAVARGRDGSGARRGKGRGDRDGSRKGVCKAIKNKELKKAVENYSPQEIGCDWIDQKTFIHVGKNVGGSVTSSTSCENKYNMKRDYWNAKGEAPDVDAITRQLPLNVEHSD